MNQDKPTRLNLPLGVDPRTGRAVDLSIGPEGRGVFVVGDYGYGKTVAALKVANRLAQNPGDRVTIVTPPWHPQYADLAREWNGVHVDLAGEEDLPPEAMEARVLSVAIPPPSEDDGLPLQPLRDLRDRVPEAGRPSHLIVDPLNGLLDRADTLALLLAWAGVPLGDDGGSDGPAEEEVTDTASLVLATVSPHVACRLPRRAFGTLLVMRSQPEIVTDKIEETVFGPIPTGTVVTNAWFRYEVPDQILRPERFARLPAGEGFLLEVEERGIASEASVVVELDDGERALFGLIPQG